MAKTTPKSQKSTSKPLPGPTGTAKDKPTTAVHEDSDGSLEEDTNEEVCCVCNMFIPVELQKRSSLICVKMDKCGLG